MTPIKRLMLCLLGGVIVVACDKQETSVMKSPPEPDPVAMMLCTQKKKGEIWSSEYEKGLGFHLVRSECDQHNPTALLIAKCTHEYAEYIKGLDTSSSERAEEICKKELRKEAPTNSLNSGTGR